MAYLDFYQTLIEQIVEEYPATWNKDEFERIDSFAGKLRYAKEHLQKIGSGSGRMVFKIDDKKALKIAKNKKGLAQNASESDGGLNEYAIAAKTFDVGDEVQGIGPFWVEMELAKKLSTKRFQQITGISFGLFQEHVTDEIYRHKNISIKSTMPKDMKEKMYNDEFIMDLMSLVVNYDMLNHDLIRLSSYGEVEREGSPSVVLVDLGLNKGVGDAYYS